MRTFEEIVRGKQETRLKRIETCPESARGGLKRCYAKESSPRAAIKAMCMECIGFDREAITMCTAVACPLWEYRPFQNEVGV